MDDLMALAAALGVSPVTLLMPLTNNADETTDATVGTGDCASLVAMVDRRNAFDRRHRLRRVRVHRAVGARLGTGH